MIDLDRTSRTHLLPAELAEILGICVRTVQYRISRHVIRADRGKWGGWRIPIAECKLLRDMELGVSIPEKSTPAAPNSTQSHAKSA